MYDPNGEKGDELAGALGLLPKVAELVVSAVLSPLAAVLSMASMYDPNGLLGAAGLGLDGSFLGVPEVLSIEFMYPPKGLLYNLVDEVVWEAALFIKAATGSFAAITTAAAAATTNALLVCFFLILSHCLLLIAQ